MDERRIAEEALHWFETLNRGEVAPPERAAFGQWLKRSPRNVQHFLFATALDRTLGSIDPGRRLDVDEMLAAVSHDVVPLRDDPPPAPVRAKRSWSVRRIAAACAASVAAGVAAWFVFGTPGAQSYATVVGEQRTVQLDDGSVMQLNTTSRVRAAFTGQNRTVDLLAGEALFKVAPDASRPFLVRAAGSVIEVLGTEFNVHRTDRAVTVSVLEGKVAVTAVGGKTTLSAGEAARVSGDSIKPGAAADVAAATAWRQRRLVFRATPLSDVVAEFNRYNRAPKLRLDDLDGSTRHYTGTFDADDPESLAQLLSQDSTLSVERTPEEITIRGR